MWGTKTSKFHDFWIFEPGGPLFIDSNKHDYLKIQEIVEVNLKNIIVSEAGKIRFGLGGRSASLCCATIWSNDKSNKLRTCCLIQNSLLDWNSHCSENGHVCNNKFGRLLTCFISVFTNWSLLIGNQYQNRLLIIIQGYCKTTASDKNQDGVIKNNDQHART